MHNYGAFVDYFLQLITASCSILLHPKQIHVLRPTLSFRSCYYTILHFTPGFLQRTLFHCKISTKIL
jgi:hypothetical protein